MRSIRTRTIAMQAAAVVAMVAVFRVGFGIVKELAGAVVVNNWSRVMPADFIPGFTFTLSFNVLFDLLTALPGAVLAVVSARAILKHTSLPLAALSALIAFSLDKRLHSLILGASVESRVILLVSASTGPLTLLLLSFIHRRATNLRNSVQSQ